MSEVTPAVASKQTRVERALGLITDVRRGESTTALLLTINVFILLTAYYVIKPVREGLILELKSGAEYKSMMSAAIAVALLVLVPAYAWIAGRLPRNRLVVGVTLFFVSHLVLFYLGSSWEPLRSQLGLIFYAWVGIFNMMLVAQFWAFANDIYDEERGKRLFPLVGLGASVGAAVGSKIAELLAKPIGRYQLLLVSAVLLLACAALFHLVHAREVRAAAPRPRTDTRDSEPDAPTTPAGNGDGAFAMVLRHRYLRLLALFSLTFTVVNTNGEYLLGKLFKAAASAGVANGSIPAGGEGDFLTAQFGGFFFYVNVLGVLLQMFAVSRIVKFGGLRIAFFILPCLVLLGSVAFIALPVLAVLRVSKTLENATDYSLNNTVRNMLWLPTTREMKYRAKQAVDTFFVRMGDVTSAGFVFGGATWLGLELRSFALVNTAVVVLWLVLALAIVRENAKLSGARRPGAAT